MEDPFYNIPAGLPIEVVYKNVFELDVTYTQVSLPLEVRAVAYDIIYKNREDMNKKKDIETFL